MNKDQNKQEARIAATRSKIFSIFKEVEEAECSCKGFQPIPQKSVHFSSENVRDILIKILVMCKETEITSFVNSLDDMSRLFERSNPTLNEFFAESCFI